MEGACQPLLSFLLSVFILSLRDCLFIPLAVRCSVRSVSSYITTSFFTIIAEGVSDENKYIQSATLNGKELNHAWFAHEDLINEGVLILKMGNRQNKMWGIDCPPPSHGLK